MDDLEPVPSPVQEIGGKYMYKYIYSVRGNFLLEIAMRLTKCAKSHNQTILNLNRYNFDTTLQFFFKSAQDSDLAHFFEPL